MPDTPAEHEETADPVTRPDHHGSGVAHPVEEVKPRRRLRKTLIRMVVLLVLLGAVLIALTPMLVSTGPGTRWLISTANQNLPGELDIAEINLSWLSGQGITGVQYNDPAQGLSVQVASVDAGELALLNLLRGNWRLGDVVLRDVDVTYTQVSADERPEPVDPPMAQSPGKPLQLPKNLSGRLSLEDVTVTYTSEGFEPVVVSLAQGEVAMPDLRDITLDLQAGVKQGERVGQASLMGSVLNLFDPDGVAQAGQAAYDLTFDTKGITTAALDQLRVQFDGAAQPGQLIALLGEGELVSQAKVKGTIGQLASQWVVQTPKLQVALDQRAEGSTLVASPDSSVRFKLDQAAFEAVFPETGLKLVEPTQIDLASLSMALPIVDKAVDWQGATASFTLQGGDNLAVVDERGEVLGINNLRVAGGSKSIAEELSLKLSTTLSAVDEAGEVTSEPVAVDLTVRQPLEPTREVVFFSERLPIALADALMGQDGQLVLWLDRTLALQAEMQGRLTADDKLGPAYLEQHFSLRPDGRVSGTVTGSFSAGRFHLATPENEPIEAVLTPQAFASLMSMVSGRADAPALTIDEDMPVYLTLRDETRGPVSITTLPGKEGIERFYPDPDRTYLAATIELSPARVFDPKLEKTYELRGGMLTLSAPDLRGKTTIGAELDLWVRPDAGKEGIASLMTWQTTVTDLLDSEGSLPLDGSALMEQLAASGALKLENAPSGLFDSLLNREGDLASILGPIVQAMDAGFTYEDGQPTGASVRLNWDEASGQPMTGAWASMKPAAFDIDQDQMLTVRGGEDLEIEVKVSEDFGDRWMGQLHPILFDAKSGDRPVKIKIDGKSFRFPLQGDAMAGAHVEATVDLGSITFGDGALLGRLMEWTNRPGERAVFEPAVVRLVDGKLSYNQFDLAVGQVKLRLDGEVDLASGQIVDMAVRVPGDSLIRVFNELDGVIPKDDYLSIPMTGAIRKPEFDTGLIGREVTRLLAQGLIDQQKDRLKEEIGDELGDLIRRGLGDGEEEAAPEEEQEQEPADPVEELIDDALDRLFKRLGGNRGDGG